LPVTKKADICERGALAQNQCSVTPPRGPPLPKRQNSHNDKTDRPLRRKNPPATPSAGIGLVLIVGSPATVVRYGLPRERATSALVSSTVTRAADSASRKLCRVSHDCSTVARNVGRKWSSVGSLLANRSWWTQTPSS